MHPEAPVLSARSVWDRFLPGMTKEIDALQAMEAASPAAFTHFFRLYQQQSYCPAEFLRRVLSYQQQQSPWLKPDPRLQYDDLSLFGFHSLADWFGRDFVDLSAEFILNAAKRAEQKGYRVSLEEAKGDLIRNFNASMQKLAEMKNRPDLSFRHHLRMLGFDEKSAAEAWRSVLLFRRYFHGVGEATFVDRLPYRDFASYALETAVVQHYQWPPALRLKSFQDLVELQVYLKAVSSQKDPLALPTSFLSVDEVEKKFPELVQTAYRAKVSEAFKEEIGLRASVKEVWDWQLDEKNWEEMRKAHSFLKKGEHRDERFRILESLGSSERKNLDRFARVRLVEQNPAWIEEKLLSSGGEERSISVSKDWVSLPHVDRAEEIGSLLRSAAAGEETAKSSLAQYKSDESLYYRIENVEKVSDRRILAFEEAKREGILERVAERFLESEYPKIRARAPSRFQIKEGEWKPFASVKDEVASLVFSETLEAIGGGRESYYRRLEKPAKEAAAALEKNPDETRWLQGSGDPLIEQFKLVKRQAEIQRTSKEKWMKEQAFVMVPKQWSPVHVPPDGDVSFFYFETKKPHSEPILEQMTIGKETISADAQRYVAERLIESAKKKHSIVIPLQMEKE
jgi:hypothetical protein